MSSIYLIKESLSEKTCNRRKEEGSAKGPSHGNVIRQRRQRRLKRRTLRRLGEDRKKVPEQNGSGNGAPEETDHLKM